MSDEAKGELWVEIEPLPERASGRPGRCRVPLRHLLSPRRRRDRTRGPGRRRCARRSPTSAFLGSTCSGRLHPEPRRRRRAADPARPIATRSRIPRSAATAAASGRPSRSRRREPGAEIRDRGPRHGSGRRSGGRSRGRAGSRRTAAPVTRPLGPGRVRSRGRIAVAMATYNPDMDLFRAQVESLRAQTDRNWVCVVNDDRSRPDRFREIAAELDGDERFVLSRVRPPARLLPELRAGARRWCPTTPHSSPSATRTTAGIRRSSRRCAPSSAARELIYSDQRLVDVDGSGARRHLLDEPAQQPHEPALAADRQHDHGGGLADAARGRRAGAAVPRCSRRAVPRPLARPRRADAWATSPTSTGRSTTTSSMAARPSATRRPTPASAAAAGFASGSGIGYWRGRFAAAGAAYFRGYVRLEVLARGAARARMPEASPAQARRPEARSCGPTGPAAGIAWLRAPRSSAGLVGRNETLGVETMLAESLLWRHGLRHHSRDWERPIGSPFDASLPPRRSPGEAVGEAYPDPETAHIERLLDAAAAGSGLRPAEPERVNLLIPTIDLRHLFGGYIAKFNLARKLAEAGHRVRIVTVDPTPPLPADWREQVEAYSGLAGAMSTDRGRFRPRAGRGRRSAPRPLRRDDVVDRLPRPRRDLRLTERRAVPLPDPGVRAVHVRDGLLGGSRDARPTRSPMPRSSRRSSCRAYFAAHRYGVSPGPRPEAADRDSVSFQNAITAVRPPTGRSWPTARAGGCSSMPAPSRTRSGTCSSSG